MPGENKEIVRKGYAAYAAGDFAAWLALLDPEISVYPRASEPGAESEYHGVEACLAYIANWQSQWDSYEVEPVEFFEVDDVVVAVMRERGQLERAGINVEEEFSYAFKLTDGKIVEWRHYDSFEEAAAAAGLRDESPPAVRLTDGLAYREAAPDTPTDRVPALCIHGWPQSSYMWHHLLPALASAGRRAVAPDLAGYGDSPPDPPGTYERHVEAVERFRRQLGLERAVLVVHDTGGLIGLRWACDHPDAVAGLVITNTGFFPDVEWIEIAQTMRTPVQGEALVDSLSREGFGTLLAETSEHFDESALDEYWKAFRTETGRRGMLELYRSFELDELAPYQARLAALDVPTLILWGQQDEFIPLDFASRFATEIPGSKLVLLEGVRHFLFDDAPDRCAREVVGFLEQAGI